MPAALAKFEDLLLKYYEDYQSEALSDDLKKEALKEIIPPALTQTVNDIMIFRNMSEDALNAVQVKTIVMERIAGDVQDQMIRMDVDQVEVREPSASQPSSGGRLGQQPGLCASARRRRVERLRQG